MSPRRETLNGGDAPAARGDEQPRPARATEADGQGAGRPGRAAAAGAAVAEPAGTAETDAPLSAPSPDSRLVDTFAGEQDLGLEPSLRPRRLAEFVGQSQLKERLSIILEAARRRGQPVDHILFAGPPGLGKTTLAGIVAAEMGAGFRITSGPTLVRTGDVAAILTDLQPGDVLFIDEIHRLGRAVEEVLYPAMEDFQLDIVIGKGPTARSIRLELPKFTLVGATTRTGLVTGPLRDRFGIVARLDHYQPEELVAIVNRSARLLGLDLTTEGAEEISGRSRGTPRLALRLLRRVRDFVEVRGCQVATLEEARAGLDRFGVDELGLDHVDRTILETLCLRFSGRPVGLSTLAISVGEEPETVEDVYEPFLLKAGLMQRTPRGRIATEAAYEHLGVDIPDTLVQLGPLGFSASRGGGGASRAPGRPPRLFEADMDEGAQEAPEAGSG